MSFLSFLGQVFLLDWLLGDDEEEKIAKPPKSTYDYYHEFYRQSWGNFRRHAN